MGFVIWDPVSAPFPSHFIKRSCVTLSLSVNSNHNYCWSLLFKILLWSTWVSSNSNSPLILLKAMWSCNLIIKNQNKSNPFLLKSNKSSNAFGWILKTMWQINLALKLWKHFYKITNNLWTKLVWLWLFIELEKNANK